MDIIDVDEALKDDSFIFLEDKTHDDISNILQQWKSSNSTSLNKTTLQPEQQRQQEQAYKYDSRTFTRPKRKSAQNIELQFTNNTQSPYQHQQTILNAQPDNPMLNLKIGGLVTNMQKSFLENTSPPPFSSMDVSIDRMNNSLITSADFSNVNFLQSANSIDFKGLNTVGYTNFNMTNKVTSDGYSLSDMIQDRKTLESLTMSSDGALIKDAHIGQIDDISFTLSKTASGCTTMDNSTESVEANNHTVEMINSNVEQHLNGSAHLELVSCNDLNLSAKEIGVIDSNLQIALQRTIVLSDQVRGDITYNLVENSMYMSVPSEQAVITQNCKDAQKSEHQTAILDETKCVSREFGTDSGLSNVTSADMRCETPKKIEKNGAKLKQNESTPLASSALYSKQQYTTKLKMICDENISPIVPQNKCVRNATKDLNESCDNEQYNLSKNSNNVNTNTFSGKLPLMHNFELIQNIENPTFDKTFNMLEEQSPTSLEMKNVMDLAEATNNNEEEFDNMLNTFSKVKLNEDQIKMKKSLDFIKKRFNYGPNRDKSQQKELSREANDMRDMTRVSADVLSENDNSSTDYLSEIMDVVAQNRDELNKSKEQKDEMPNVVCDLSSDAVHITLKDSVTTSSITDSKVSSSLSLSAASVGSNERLLSRRSRLYDDFNMSTLASSPNKTTIGSSFAVEEDDKIENTRSNITFETEHLSGQNPLEMVQEKTETYSAELLSSQISDNTKEPTSVAQYRLVEKRNRNRDRFKTIKINKNRNGNSSCENDPSGCELNVPCIDDCSADGNFEISMNSEQIQRCSRRDNTTSSILNYNKLEVETNNLYKTTSKINPNFLTYKKPKDKLQCNVRNLPEVSPDLRALNVGPEVAFTKQRSLSRPRYLSGLTKFSAVSKATSADELEKSSQLQSNINIKTSTLNVGLSKVSSAANISLNRTQIVAPSEKPSSELKSPMGTKSKSFHNLSTHHNYSSTSNNTVGSGAGLLGLKKQSATGFSTEKLTKTNQNRNSSLTNTSSDQTPITQQKSDESVFKVPKLVSGIRAPGASMQSGGGGKRIGLVRPSSGYYSLSLAAKPVQVISEHADLDAGRHSSTDSMSSASSRESAQTITRPAAAKACATSSKSTNIKYATSTLTKITIGSTGVQKPSGLRPPSNIKRSGLPRPSSFTRTDK